MELKGYFVGGCMVVADNENEAVEMYVAQTGNLPHSPVIEKDLDETFYYFELHEIEEEDHKNIYDRKYPHDGKLLVSLPRQFAKKYREVSGTKKEVVYLFC